ncbi:MAG: hypothetical protein CMH30_00550 [Micavibrio sp.]|nr:hypothetical protein [Micavibrio sp.]
MTDKTQKDNERQTILGLYGAFAATIIAHLYPVGIMGLLAICLAIAVMIYAYVLKAKAEPSSLTHNHMVYIIRTIWIGSVYLLIFMAIALFYLWPRVDMTLINMVARGELSVATPEDIKSVEIRFMLDNKQLMLESALMAFTLPAFFFIYRCTKGVIRAAKGYRLNNIRSWF